MKDVGLLVLRLALGSLFLRAGYGKLNGGMEGFTGLVNEAGFPVPEISAWIAALGEAIGGGLMILGLLTRVGGALTAGVMAGAIIMVHWGQPYDKWEEVVVYLAGCLAILFCGGGEIGADRFLFKTVEEDAKG